MKTEVVMKRPLFGMNVSQKSKSEMLSGTDLVRAGNKWRRANGMGDFNLSQWIKSAGTEEFMKELEGKYGKVIIKGRGRSAHTWMHPLLFIDCALAMSPKLKIETYEWLFDSLLKYRNDSGDSYNKMVGHLYNRWGDKKTFSKFIQQVARDIRIICNTQDWQSCGEKQLKVRCELQNEISLLCDVLQDPKLAVQIGFARVMKIDYEMPKIRIDRG